MSNTVDTTPAAGTSPAIDAWAGLDERAKQRLDAAVEELRTGSSVWSAMPLRERAALLAEVRTATAAVAERWARTASDIKRLDPDSALTGEEWMSGPYAMLSGINALAATVVGLAEGRGPLDDVKLKRGPGGRVRIPVLPHESADRVLLNGFSAEVWTVPGIDEETVRRTAGLGQLDPQRSGGVGVVLGAGNITSIAPLDVLSELYAHNRVVLLKLNPIMSAMMTVYLEALGPFIRAGLVRVVQGGAEVGAYLTQHPGVDHVHITGSAVTHDLVVWGAGGDAEQRRANDAPLLGVPITSELGGVSPVIVVPGKWSKRDLKYQAEHIATQRLHNSGHNCIASQVVLVSADWEQRDDFLSELERAMSNAPHRPVWYPGASKRIDAAAETYAGSARLGPERDRVVVVLDLDESGAAGEAVDLAAVCTTEYFAPVLGVIEIDGLGGDFLDAAVEFANDKLVGTLGANILIDPATRRTLGTRFTRAVTRMRYGTIAINTWTGLGFLTATATWGAFPGHTLQDVQSGIGTVHNALLIDNVERTIVTGPFRDFPRSIVGGEATIFPKPPWFVQSPLGKTVGQLLTSIGARKRTGSEA